MNWTEKDNILFSIIHTFFRDQIGAQIQTSSELFKGLNKRPTFFSIFGYCDLQQNQFSWINNMNNICYLYSKKYLPIFGSDETLKKLFQPNVFLDKKYINVIPHLMDLLNSKLSVVEFKSNNVVVYALVNLEVEKDSLNYEIFEPTMCIYREYSNQYTYSKKSNKKSHKQSNKSHKNKSVYECKEKLV
jgi:hypothetical protein